MKPELMLLAWAVLLTFVQMLIAVAGATRQVGLPALAGNREALPPCTGWAGRAARAHHNMLESLVLFAALVLIAVAAGKTDANTLLGAQIFFWARLVYAVVYIAGIAWVRTAVWFASIVGLALIFFRVVA
ncbi:MAG TPA: MAPEG family protein [Burkholderiales bacterium]|nr:MAPEG family protein [Burkholderiales bacterium]